MSIDVGAARLLAYVPPAAAPAGGLGEVRREARAYRKYWNQALKAQRQAPPAPVAYPYAQPWAVPAPLTAALASLTQMLSALQAWLFPPAPAPAPPPPSPQPPAPHQPGPQQPAPQQPAPQPSGRAARFTISSFNILGSNHTVPGADAAHYASGPTRTRWAAQILEAKGVDVVGFQEMAQDQAAAFQAAAGDTFGLFPGTAKKGALASHNSIAWRKDVWQLEKAYLVDMVSHKGRNQPSPVVRLRHKETGREAIFLNFHNAPGYHIGTQQANRDRARAAQVELVSRLQRETGLPVIVTGDMNEKDAYYRDMTRQAGMHAANEGPRGQAPKQMAIDWIFGSAGVDFSKYQRTREGLGRKVSDHAMLVSEVKLG